MQQQTDRLVYLDAIRGLAALSVMVSHVIASHWAWMPAAKWGINLFNGNDAVSMFFVLSGLVLSRKVFNQGTEITPSFYKRFVVSRVFRLYPAYLAMFLLYYLYAHRDQPFGELWGQTLTKNPHFFWEGALLVRGHYDHFFPAWTLGVEVGMSLLVPFLIIIAQRSSRLLVGLMIASMLAGGMYISEFVVHFGLGILLAKHFDEIKNYRNDGKWWYANRRILVPSILLGYFLFHYVLTHHWPASLNYFMSSILSVKEYIFSGIASAIILITVINSQRLQGFFSHGIFDFFGKISYGVYLSHWLFTTYVMHNFDYFKANFAGGSELRFFIFYLIATTVFSVGTGLALYHLVEMPFIKWGRRIASKLR